MIPSLPAKVPAHYLLTLLFISPWWGCFSLESRQKGEYAPAAVDASALLPPIRSAPRLPLDGHSHFPALSLVAVGDIMLGGSALSTIEGYGCDYPFDSTRAILSQGDIAIGNLEAPFTSAGEKFDKKYTFRVPNAWACGLRDAGFDLLTLANNHIMDYGLQGLYDTMEVLDSLGIAHCGAGANDSLAMQAAFLYVNQLKVAFLGFSMTFPEEFWAEKDRAGTAFATERRLAQRLREVRPLADLLIVSFHWGAELKHEPKEYQRSFAHQAIDLGADLVLGHHAHVLQGVEAYKNRLVFYGLGNFAFGSYSTNARSSVILKIYLMENGPFFAQLLPISVDNYEVAFQPRILRGMRKRAVLEGISDLSLPLNNGEDILSDEGYIIQPRH